jgi:hypothetical protein
MFRDGTCLHDELGNVELSKIREVCSQQSRTNWTSIASCEQLYQFIALSDEDTQLEMRQKALSLIPMDWTAVASSSSTIDGRKGKRYVNCQMF